MEDLENWAKQSGMGVGARADALGDEPEEDEDEDEEDDAALNGGVSDDDLQSVEKMEERDKSVRGSVY